jgi:hypothetical protein
MLHLSKIIQLLLFVSLPWRIFPSSFVKLFLNPTTYSQEGDHLDIEGGFNDPQERKIGVLKFTDLVSYNKAKREAEAKEAGTGKTVKIENYIRTEHFDMVRLQSLDLVIDLVNEKIPVPKLTRSMILDEVPDAIIDHTAVMATPEGDEREAMCILNLETQRIEGRNGWPSIPVKDLDWTETAHTLPVDLERPSNSDLVVRLSGPSDVSYIRLDTAFSKNQWTGIPEETKQLISAYLENSINDLENTIRSGSKEEIEEKFRKLEQTKWIAGFTINMLKQNFYSVPRERFQSEKFHKEKSEKIPSVFRRKQKYLDKAAKVQKKSKDIDQNLHDSIRDGIDSVLSQTWQSKRQAIWEAWSKAEHFDELLDAELLKNPLLAGAFVMEMAEKAGKATYTIEKIKAKSDKDAKDAQKKAEENVFDDINKAISEFRDNRNEDTLESLRSAIRKTLHHTVLLQATADAAEATQKFAQLIGEISDDPSRADTKKDFVEKAKNNSAQKESVGLIGYITSVARGFAEDKMTTPIHKNNVDVVSEQNKIVNAIE